MKKTYITPSVETIKVSAVNMMATSLQISNTEVDTVSEQLGREDNGPSAPGVWDSEW
ncbi:MAG: hypothetical protein IKB39_05880 [Bacteroidaceae bacterium]|nr:hypothetical protein [Bacteroidaceae bacterium]